MAVPYLPEQAVSMALDVGPNLIFVNSPTILKIPGGAIRFGPLAFKDIFTSKLSINTSITLNAIDIQPLLSEF